MKNVVEAKVHGIKCDNPDCDFIDISVKYEDYSKWVDQPCPKCGANLLTKADYKICRRLVRLTKIVNFFLPKRKDEVSTITVEAKFNGTDCVDFVVSKEAKTKYIIHTMLFLGLNPDKYKTPNDLGDDDFCYLYTSCIQFEQNSLSKEEVRSVIEGYHL